MLESEGADLPEARLELRPGFPLELLADADSRETFIDAVTCFFHQANCQPSDHSEL